jgi:hypothetical protein
MKNILTPPLRGRSGSGRNRWRRSLREGGRKSESRGTSVSGITTGSGDDRLQRVGESGRRIGGLAGPVQHDPANSHPRE